MSLLGLYLAGPVLGLVIATVYWCGRAIDHDAAEARRAMLESPAVKALAERMVEVFGRQGLDDTALWDAVERSRARDTEVHTEALKLRAYKVASNLAFNGQSFAASAVMKAIKAGDREALEALLREENAS